MFFTAIIMHDRTRIKDALKTVFGFSDFERVKKILSLPSHQAKTSSLLCQQGWLQIFCYQLPAITRTSKTIIISPLVALMSDQVASLEIGIAAEMIHSGQIYDDNVISLAPVCIR